ncbi:MAG: pilus assembly protein PilM [Candidatus Omnitrophica bacterium]|nr:pilus assembly protein PilM [Candidatus Omnitrophota bacterium]
MNILSLRKKTTGLHIGHDTVDLVVLRGTLRGPKLVKFGQTYIYPKEKHDEIIPESSGTGLSQTDDSLKKDPKKTRDDYIVEAIKRVFSENNVKPGNVISSIPSEEVMVRYFQMPKIPRQEWSSAVNFEAKRYIPFRMEDVSSDFQVMLPKQGLSSMDVVFAAVKQNAIRDVIKLIESAGARPNIIEPAPFSLIRAFNAAGQINSKVNTAVVSINKKSANIDILRNGVPYIIRDIALDEGASEGKSLEPIFEKLLAEIKLSFDFYEKQFPAEVIDKIIIHSQLPLENWHELVGKELQIPVETGDPLRGVRVNKEIVPSSLAVAFGLALRGLSEPFVDVNLCKEKLKIYRYKEMFLKLAFLEASAAVFLLILLKVIGMRAIAPLTKEYERTISERPKAEVSIKDDSIGALESAKNSMEEERNLLADIISNRVYITMGLSDFVKFTPDNMWLTEVNYEENASRKRSPATSRQLNIKGYCVIDTNVSETDMVNHFLLNLKESYMIKKSMRNADIVSVEKTEVDGRKVANFEIIFTGH